MGNMAVLLQQLAKSSFPETTESYENHDPEDDLPLAKEIHKDKDFCESGSISIHADDDKKALLEESQQPGEDDQDEQDQGDEAFLDALAESLDNLEAVTDDVMPQLAITVNKH